VAKIESVKQSRHHVPGRECSIRMHEVGGDMFTIPELAAEALGSHLAQHMGRRFGSTDAELIELVQSAARLSIDCIGNTDALYHNVEHTMLVTLVGYDILKGRRLFVETTASDFAHLTLACLFHDIGYVRGILNGDSTDNYVVDAKSNRAKLPRGSSDAALAPCHVDRSKLMPLVSPMPLSARAFRQLMVLTTTTMRKACW
jgi:hypothetical protein